MSTPEDPIDEWIDDLKPMRPIDESAVGHMTILDRDTQQIYLEINKLLKTTGSVTPETREAFETQLSDLFDALIDTHKRTEEAFDLACQESWGW